MRLTSTSCNRVSLMLLKSMPCGKCWRRRPLVFSLLPLCQGLCGSQK